jgi:purine-nucleoside phosphorylase
MKTELENNKITNGFTTPKDYFDTLSNKIDEKINGEVNTQSIPKRSGFIVPEDFFVKNEAKLLARINSTEAKVVSLKHTLYKVSGIAAVLLLTIVSPMLYNSAETKNNELVEMSYLQLHSEELSVYEVGSMLEEKELIELENELIYNNLNNIN